MQTTHPQLGMNRTGIATSPKLTKEMVSGTDEFNPMGGGDERVIALARGEVIQESEPPGSVPPPTTATGALKTATKALRGESLTQFIDKLGERIAFERSGTRLYQAVLSKYDAQGSFEGGPTRQQLVDIAEQEHAHFQMLVQAVTKLGGDPTVMTPSADLHATMTEGPLKVATDPRISLAATLEAALLAELVDNECWPALAQLAEEQGEDALRDAFIQAASEEQIHLVLVRGWVAAAQQRVR